MKAGIGEEEEGTFKPFVVSMEIESMDELLALLHRVNTSWHAIGKEAEERNVSVPLPEKVVSTMKLYDVLKDKYKELTKT